ncbi:gene transfer agent family protein [Enterovirga rhinocerotis]|uniref:Tail tube GTA-gp10-like protein n=1 Tax=Enterovirga rhinocerotis TaxID=1339210 RepID=A0A4R7BTB4_9HYPH|nr:gene transfer agent family protein [Enterovirga rhinocerotis]TDR88960.1 tail tube GTA-gp10-like protein [Enterovirga rhinocerotis]
MINRRRGEVAAVIAGERYRLCLTLGGLAELEHGFGVEDLSALAARFASGRLAARDLVRLLGAGLRGGGHPISDEEVEAMPIAGSLAEIAAAVAALLDATFGGPGEGAPADPTLPA